jgi:transcriptional regulator with XRE-family HTH domain
MTQSDGAQRRTIALDGTRLRELRRQHGLSQERLADRAGLSLTTVARLESRPTSPCRGRTLGRLAAALGEEPEAISLAGARAAGRGTSQGEDEQR